MNWMRIGIVLACTIVASPGFAGDGNQLTPDQIPPKVASLIRETFGTEPLHARKIVEGGKACYLVTVTQKGEVIEIYASPDGSIVIRKTEEFSLGRWWGKLPVYALFLLLLAIGGALARGVVRAARGRSLSVPAGWLSVWAGTGVGMALIVFNVSTVPRQKDVLVFSGYCIVWAAIAASVVEMIVLALFSGKGNGAERRRWMIASCVLATGFLAFTIPLDFLRIERENSYSKKMTLRPLNN